MKKLFLILALATLFPSFALGVPENAQKDVPAAREQKSSERVAILGDSIAYAGGWPTLLTEALKKNKRFADAEIVNFGLPSETLNGLSEPGHAGGAFPRPCLFDRLPRLLAEFQPTLVFACYGMNDGMMNPSQAPLALAEFRRACLLLEKECAAAGARLIFITPPLYCPGKRAQHSYDAELDAFAKQLVSEKPLGAREVIDIRPAVKKALVQEWKKNPRLVYAGDGVHPGEFGHRAIAAAIYDGLVPVLSLKKQVAFPQGEDYQNAFARQAKLRDDYLSKIPHKRPEVAGYVAGTLPVPAADDAKISEWGGFTRHDFKFENRSALIVLPKNPARGAPWIWRTEFFGHEPQGDLALLKEGWAVVYLDVQNMYGSPKAVEIMTRFYENIVKTYALSRRPVLEGFSRGGLFAFNWAAKNPRCVAGIYGDAPVCDFKSWPAGRGNGQFSQGDWKRLQQVYEMSEAELLAWKGNPVDNLKPLAEADVPVLCIVRREDKVVPVAENTDVLEKRYRKLGGKIKVIRRPGDHHPHSLSEPSRIVDFAKMAFDGTRPPVRVACIGDSITFGARCPREKRWSNCVQEILGDKFAIHNFGVNGRTMLTRGNLPYIHTREYALAQSVHADIYLIALGTNDSKPYNWDAHKKDFSENAKTMIETIRRDTPKAEIFLLTPIPADEPGYEIRGDVIAKEIVPLVKKIAKENKCGVIDTYSIMKKHLKKADKFTDLLPDGVHPNAEGHSLMAEFIAEELRSRK